MAIQLTTNTGGTATLPEDAFHEFAMFFHGRTLVPGDARYDEARIVQNGMFDSRPGLILQCTGAADVVDAVNLVREHRLVAAVRGGGHSVAGLSTCDGGVLIDLSRMTGVHVDPARKVARVQGGATWGDVDRETQLFGLATPGGVVSTTGVAGLTLGGGLGWLRRAYGLACDNLRSVEIVTADGELRVASPDKLVDLFWALRGGSGNFGVVTSFEFQLHPVGPLVFAALPMYPVEQMAEVLRGWRAFVAEAPDEVTSEAVVITMPAAPNLPPAVHDEALIIPAAMYAGAAEEGERVLHPLRELGTPLADISSALPYRALQMAFDALFPKGELRSYWKSTHLGGLGDEVIDVLARAARARPTPLTMFTLWHLGGVMGRVGPSETAFSERDAPFLVSIDGNWADAGDDDDAVGFVRRVWDDLQPFSAGGPYVNFAGREDRPEELVRAAYGANYRRLAQAKAKYDPDNLFRLNPNVRPARGDAGR